MKLHPDSHVDHGLSPAQVAYLLLRFSDRSAFFIETVDLPDVLGTCPCNLAGPIVGDAPVREEEVSYRTRPPRAWRSRMVARPPRRSRQVTVVAGPHDEDPCVLFTAYGGPQTPQEPDDPACLDPATSRAFWQEHALVE